MVAITIILIIVYEFKCLMNHTSDLNSKFLSNLIAFNNSFDLIYLTTNIIIHLLLASFTLY